MKTSAHRAEALRGIISAELQLALARDILRQCKAEAEAAEHLQRLGVTAYDVEFDEYGGWKAWWLFTKGAPFAPDVAAIHRARIREDGDTVAAFLALLPLAFKGSGGPGQAYAGRPHIRSTPNHILVTQTGGLDI
jgi:hypothetical protein